MDMVESLSLRALVGKYEYIKLSRSTILFYMRMIKRLSRVNYGLLDRALSS